jgi:hypothetical protein
MSLSPQEMPSGIPSTVEMDPAIRARCPGVGPLLTGRPKRSAFGAKHTEWCLCYNEVAEGSRTPPLSHLAEGQGNEMEATQWA